VTAWGIGAILAFAALNWGIGDLSTTSWRGCPRYSLATFASLNLAPPELNPVESNRGAHLLGGVEAISGIALLAILMYGLYALSSWVE